MKTVTIRYGKIPGYRNPRRKSWGFEISDPTATFGNCNQYTCPRRSAQKTYEKLKKDAEDRGFTVKLIVDDEAEISISG